MEQNLKLITSYPRTSVSDTRVAASLSSGLYAEDAGYTRLNSSKTDLLSLSYDELREKAFYLWQRNPLAKRLLEIFVDFCTGEDLKVKIVKKRRLEAGEEVIDDGSIGQQVWDDFYEDPLNNFELELPFILIDWFINGEIALPVNINPIDGSVRLGYIAPQNIKEVIPLPTDNRIIDAIVVSNGVKIERLKVIRYNTDPSSPRFGKLDGNVLFFQINRIPSQLRGYSLLIEHVDWLKSFDDFLYNVLQGYDARNKHFYEIIVEGSEQDVKNINVTIPNNGGYVVHNDKVKWNVLSPNLQATDATVAAQMMIDFIAGTKGIPKTWLGKGDETNRATAEALTVPTMRMLKRHQMYVKKMLKFVATYILQESRKISLNENEYYDVEVSLFSLGAKDVESIGGGFTSLVSALAVAEDRGWINPNNAKKLIDGIVSSYGVEVEPNETVEEIKQQLSQSEVESIYNKPADV